MALRINPVPSPAGPRAVQAPVVQSPGPYEGQHVVALLHLVYVSMGVDPQVLLDRLEALLRGHTRFLVHLILKTLRARPRLEATVS